MAISGGPDIIQDSLIVSLDASDRNSYPGSGTTWFDLSGNGNNFTLFNGVGYSTANGGSLTFDGTNDYAASTNNLNLTSFSYVAVEIFYRSNTSTPGIMLFEHTADWNTNTGGLGLAINSTGVASLANSNHTNHKTGSAVGANIARNFLVTSNTSWNDVLNLYSGVSDSTGRLSYENGSLDTFVVGPGYPTTTVTTAGGLFANAIFYIGSRGGVQDFLNGSIGSLKIYGFKISAPQVFQNYNAIKSRFNL
jgi:hypothetical protein